MRFNRLAIISVVACCAAGSTEAATIDLFEAPQSVETALTAPPPQGSGSVAPLSVSVIGLERDLFVIKTSGADDERLRARVNPLGATNLRIDADSEVLGSVLVTWDGVDADPNPFTGINYDGLGGVDFTAGADAFEIVVSFSDVGGPLNFSVYDNTANSAAAVAKATLFVPAGIAPMSPMPLLLPFSSFTGTTSALSNAGAIVMEVQNSFGAWDLNIGSVRTVPEPTSIVGLGLGVLLTVCRRRRRR